jgi:hypothetical protein
MESAVTPSTSAHWLNAVAADVKNYSVLLESKKSRDAEAYLWVQEAKSHLLRDGIASCIARNSDSLALPIATALVATPDVASLMQELAQSGFLTDISVSDEPTEPSLLLITPAR